MHKNYRRSITEKFFIRNVIYMLNYGIYMLQSLCGGIQYLENGVKIARTEVNLTQQQLAEKIDVTRQTISLIEKGKYNPTLKLCLDICYEVNKTLDEVFWIEKENDNNEKNFR